MRPLRVLSIAAAVVGIAAVAVYAGNSSALAPPPSGKPSLIAHRGLGQTFSRDGLTGETCTATRIFPPEHAFIENTIASFAAAFAAGADVVEFDVHPTTDGHFVVFHDWTVDCRTDGTGLTRDHSLAELKRLDIGYGYTADDGQTYPFRGLGVGLIPTLSEVLDAFPDRRFLVNIKSDDPAEGRLLAEQVAQLPPERQRLIMVYGGGKAIGEFRTALPEIAVLGTDGARRCLITYELVGWTGMVPAACRQTLLMVPLNYAPYVWGYPNRLTRRLASHGTRLVVLGTYDGSGFSSGVDEVVELDAIPSALDGAIWTNRIDRIGPALAARQVRPEPLDGPAAPSRATSK